MRASVLRQNRRRLAAVRLIPFPLLTAWLLLGLAMMASDAGGGDWPGWAGPNRDLTASHVGLFDRSTIGLERVWNRPLGSAYSGQVVVDGTLVTLFSDGTADLVAAFDAATGEEVWRYTIGPMYRGHDGSHDGPNGTPLIHDGRVYGLGPSGRLFALRLDDGEEVFSHDGISLGALAPSHGFTTAPTVVDDVLVVQTGGSGGRSVSGFDPASGDLLWQAGDDSVSYQSPLALEVDGTTLVLAVTDKSVLGIVPKSGEVLFRHEFPRQTRYVAAQPISLGDGTVLLTGQLGAGLYRVRKTSDGFGLIEVWSSRALRSSYTIPVPHGGHLYGYSGNFPTCVDAATGETVWKSRPPGRGTLILVDGHLVVLTDSGDLVVAEASPAGFSEKARLTVFDEGSLTAPSFADGLFFLRNLTHSAAVRVVDLDLDLEDIDLDIDLDSDLDTGARSPAEPSPELQVDVYGKLARFVERVKAASSLDEKRRMIAVFLDAQERFPIVEGDRWVHFVYNSRVDDLALFGNFYPESEGEKVMGRVAGTDFYYRSAEVTPAAHYTYRFQVFGEPVLDPLNPRTVEGQMGSWSELAMPGWPEPEHISAFDDAAPDGPRGRLTTLTWASDSLGSTRDVTVYLPAGYDESGESDERYPLLVVNRGDEALRLGLMANSLDHLIGRGVAPVVVAFVPVRNVGEYLSVAGLSGLTEAMVSELLPRLESNFRLLRKSGSHAILGTAFGASHAVYAALKHPEVFGRVAVQSYYAYRSRDSVAAMVESGQAAGLRAFVELNTNDLHFGPWADAEEESRELVQRLVAGGASVTTHQVADGADWSSWRSRTDVVLAALFPEN